METFTTIHLSSRGVVTFFIVSIFGLLVVSAQSNSTGESTPPTENTAPSSTVTGPPSSRTPWYPKCITSCIDEQGHILPNGDYAFCDQCNAFVKCSNGYIYNFACPLGTDYYDRILGVCVSDSKVCINDSLTTTRPTVTIPTAPVATTSASSTVLLPVTTAAETTTGEAATTTSTAQSSVNPTTTASIPTTSTTIPATSTTTPTTSTTTPTTSTTTPPTSTITPPTSTTTQTTSTTTPTTITTTPTTSTTISTTSTTITTTSTTIPTTSTRPIDVVNTTGYIPNDGGEAESFWFAIDLYNRHSQEKMRVGASRVNSVTAEALRNGASLSDKWYRLYGVILVPSMCPNTADNMSASYQKCPLLVEPGNVRSNQSMVAMCDFKVQHSPNITGANRLAMIYMMCYK